MARLLIVPAVLATALLAACPVVVPEVQCTFQFPAADAGRVASEAGFNIFIEVTGDFTVEELPRVDFFSDVEVGNAFYDGLFPEEAGTGKIMEAAVQFETEGCLEGCLAGARIDTPLTPGAHTLTAHALAANREVACRASTDVRINAPPIVEGVTILPGDAGANDDLTVAATTGDANGDPVTVSYRWTGPDGTETAGGTDGLLAAVNTIAGETWTVAVTPNDGLDFGEPGTATIQIGNTTPSAPTVVITPDPGRAEAPLRCRVTDLEDTDPDAGQELSVEWSWAKDGADQGIATDTAPASGTAAGETWTCSARVDDGVVSGEAGSASTTILQALTVPEEAAAATLGTVTGTWVSHQVGEAGQVGSPGDIDGDGGAEVILTQNSEAVTTFGDGNGFAHIFYSSEWTGSGPWDLADASMTLQGGLGFDLFGPSQVGDLNGEGLDDVVIAFAHAALPANAGNAGVYILFGEAIEAARANGDITMDLETQASKIIHPSHGLGAAPCPVGDLNGDGYAELALTAPEASLAQGVLYVVYGHPGQWQAEAGVTSLQPSFRVEGAAAGQRMGTACAAPIDLNGDGWNDLVVSAPGAGAASQGRILGFINDGEDSWSGETLNSLSSDWFIDGPTDGGGFFGLSMASLGDHDGDGFGDFAIHALTYADPSQGDSGAGGVWVVSGADPALDGATTFDAVTLTAIEGDGNIGFCQNMAGVDINGDGLGDLACGDIRPYSAVSLQTPPAARVYIGAGGGMGAQIDFDEADFSIVPDDYVFPERCQDNVDNDLDGAEDCDDLDCPRTGNNPPCSDLTCPSFAAVLTCDTTAQGTTIGAGNDLVQYSETVEFSGAHNGGCNGEVLQGDDAVYSFAPPNPGLYSVTVDTHGGANLAVALLESVDGECGPDQCLQIASAPQSTNTISFYSTDPGDVFYFAVDGAAGVSDAFSIQGQCGANGTTEICNNGADDDGDGDVDCTDSNCSSYWSCASVSHVCNSLISQGILGQDVKINTRIGASVVGVPDIDGDDFSELIVGAPSSNVPACESGAALIVDLN